MGQRRKPKFLQTRLQFTKPDPDHPSSLPSQTPLKPLPRPTAPPVFQKPAPKKKRRTDSYAFDDDYWEMGQRLIDGEPLNPGKKIVEEGAPVINVDDSNSDDDFEPPSVFSQVARQRPQLLTPTSRMRNDRSSMTKSSANRGRKTKKTMCFTTPPQKRGSTPAVNATKRSVLALDSSSSEEEVNHVVFEGEKSELSDTDEDEPVPVPLRERSKRARQKHNSRRDRQENVPCEDESAVHGRRDTLTVPKSSVLETIAQSNRMSFECEASASDFRQPGDILVQDQDTESKPAPLRARDLPPLFFDDSDDSIEVSIPKSSQRRRTRRTRRIRESSDEASQEYAEQVSLKHSPPHSGAECENDSDIRGIEMVPAIASENKGQNCVDDELCIMDTERQVQKSKSKRKRFGRSSSVIRGIDRPVSGEPVHSNNDSAKSPLRSKTRRRLSFVGSDDAEVTPSSPSPPSTRRRRLRSKLITVSSDEEIEPHRDSPKPLERPKEPQKSVEFGRVLEKNEWYHEREIDTFSSSAEDGNEPRENSSSGKVVAVRSKKRVSATKPGTQSGFLTKISTNPKESVLGVSGASVNGDKFGKHINARIEHPHRTTNVDPVNNEVIDLVDDDDFEDVPPSTTQKDNIVSSTEDIDGKDLENLNDLPSYDIDDSKPPPFNLYILCNEGESIVAMRDRLGENELMDKVMQARNAGREIIGGDKLGLTTTFNRDIFSRFSKTVVADDVSRQKKSTSLTEKALRGEYKFNYRGKDRDERRRENLSSKRGSKRTGRGKSYRSRLSNLGHRRR